MGWAMLALIGLGALGLLWLCGAPRALWSVGAAALMLGASGYALQGRPGLAGAPVKATDSKAVDPQVVAQLAEVRGMMFGRFTSLDTAFYPADALMRSGRPQTAAQMMLGAVRQSPDDAALWTWLGMTLVEADSGTMSPAAALAFRRAMVLAPRHPGPAFFYGMAQARTGQAEAAVPLLTRALALTPATASYRRDVERALLSVRIFVAMRARAAAMEGAVPPRQD